MAKEDIEDVVRVLAICFREGQALDSLELERIMSFDMEWISPDEAETAVQALIKAGWLSGPEDALEATVPLDAITSPLGWHPRPARLLKPIHVDQMGTESVEKSPTDVRSTPLPSTPRAQIPATVASPQNIDDPRAKLTPRLTKFIAKQSQLGVQEVERRAQRKAKALTYASHWVCLALVAREQGLVMDDIAAALSVY
ncbi:DUF2240 family protein [Candidatus Poseidoniales archaeon]|nr:DUF2240 family protein [Candidatus Poseidoniales archaeon]MDA9571523.1 DUF2240 family protein [Candidatus Poseidoniales archaeon]